VRRTAGREGPDPFLGVVVTHQRQVVMSATVFLAVLTDGEEPYQLSRVRLTEAFHEKLRVAQAD
jgi:hypothetical protein